VKNRTVIVVVCIALALFAFIYFIDSDSMTSGELESRADRVFYKFKRELVDSLTVTGSDGAKIVIERVPTSDAGGEEWIITEPGKHLADGAQVRAVLSAIDFLIKGRIINSAGEIDKPKYGLADPVVSCGFTMRGTTTTFRIGVVDSSGEKVYLALGGEGDTFYAVEADFLESLDKDLGDLRDKHLVSDTLSDAVGLSASRDIELKREGDGPWVVKRGGMWLLAAEDQVNEILREVGNLRAVSFVADGVEPDKLSSYGLSKSGQEISVKLPASEVSILFGNKCGEEGLEVLATVRGSRTVACVSRDLVDMLERPRSRYYEMRPAVFGDDDVKKVTLAGPGGSLVIEKDEDDIWMLPDEADVDVEQDAVGDLLKKLRETRATELVVGEEAIGTLGDPAVRVVLDLHGGGGPTELEIYSVDEQGRRKVRRKGETAVLTVTEDLLAAAVPDVLAFRRRTIASGDANDVIGLEILGAVPQKLEKKDGAWEMVEPVVVNADGTAARNLAELVANVPVKLFVAGKASKKHGLDEPWTTVKVRMVSEQENTAHVDRTGETEVILEIGFRAEDGSRYARLAGEDPVVFTISEHSLFALEHPVAARDLLAPDPGVVVGVKLTRGGNSMDAEIQDGEWKAVDGAVDSVTLKRLLVDLAATKAVRAHSFDMTDGFSTIALAIEIRTESGADSGGTTVLIFGEKSSDEKEDGYIAKKDGLDVSFVLPARIVDELAALLPV
jgi:uncharacterized protein DUF4340